MSSTCKKLISSVKSVNGKMSDEYQREKTFLGMHLFVGFLSFELKFKILGFVAGGCHHSGLKLCEKI